MSKEKTESHYKVLGTTAKISNSRIKEKYIQAVKQHPPEIDPEGFEKVRRAYETLKDPMKRKQYDLVRKYGDKVEGLLEKAALAMDNENYQKATEFFQTAFQIDPDNQSVLLGSMELAILTEDLKEMEILFKRLLEMLTDVEEKAVLYSIKSQMLHKHEYGDEALETLKEGIETYSNYTSLLSLPYAIICMDLGRQDEAWEVITFAIPKPDDETFEDIYTFVTWVNMMMAIEKWSDMSKVQSRFRKFLKNLTSEEDRDEAYDLLMDHFQDHYDSSDFRSAELYIDLVKVLATNMDVSFKELQSETKKLARLQKEVDRLKNDEAAFPLIFLHAFEWFYEDYIPSEQLSMMLNSLPSHMIDELKEEKEEYAAAIVRLSKKYPLIYKAYKENWDGLFTELTDGFNREMKRDLRRVR